MYPLVCEPVPPPAYGNISCTNDTESWNCTISCDEGYDFDMAPLDEYVCGPDTFHVWNFETEFNPEKRLPNCIGKRNFIETT